MSTSHPQTKVMIAADVANPSRLTPLLQQLSALPKPGIKIGLELLYHQSLAVVTHYRQQGYEIMLDVKMHDIPQTVTRALLAVAQVRPDWVTINLGAGRPTLQQALHICRQHQIRLIGVSYLTSLSLSDIQMLHLHPGSLQDYVLQMIRFGYRCGIRAFVCAASEARLVKTVAPDIITFCPGVSTVGADQVRTVSIAALDWSSIDYLIVGRALTQSTDPISTYRRLLTQK